MTESKWYDSTRAAESPMADNVLLAAVSEGVTLTPAGAMSLRFIGSRLAWLRMELAKVRTELEKRQ